MRNDVLNQILENIGGEKIATDSNDRNRILSAINVQLGGEPFPLDAQRNDILRAINNSFGGEAQPEFTARREFLLAIEKATHVDGVTFESYSEDSILAAIEFNTREGGLASWTPDYKGAGYIIIEPWHGKIGDTIEMTVTPTAMVGQYIISCETVGTASLYIHGGRETWNFLDCEVEIGGSAISTNTPVVLNKEVAIKVTLTVDSVLSNIAVRRDFKEPFNGSITDIKLTNADGSDNRHYPSIIKSKEQPTTLFLENKLGKFKPDEWSVDYQGADKGYVEIKPYVGVMQFQVKLDKYESVLFSDGSNGTFIGTDTEARGGRLIFNGVEDVHINGELITGRFTPILGKDYEVSCKWLNPVDRIGMYTAVGSFPFIGNIWDVECLNPDDRRHYPSIIKSKTQPTTDVLEEVLGEYSSKDYTVGYAGAGYVKLDKPWVGEVGSSIEWICCVRSTSSSLIHNGGLTAEDIKRVEVNSTGKFVFNGGRLWVNGDEYKTGDSTPTIGSEWQCTFKPDSTFNMVNLGGRQNGTYLLDGSIHDIKFYAADGTLERHYPSLIHSETKPDTLVLEDIVSGEHGTLTGFTAGTGWDNSLSNHGQLIGFGYEELPPPSSSRMGYYNSSTLTYSKDKPTQQQTDKSARSQYMTLYREKKIYDGWTNKMGKHGVMNGFAVGEEWKEV